ncbi:MAG: SDR family oxidoreductase [Azoarcus sp.]|nr:SDR family oxidoreductase [Azoarcus sp.]
MYAILTGHSRGLGSAIAAALLARGIVVLGLARHGNPALAARFPDRLLEHEIDLGQLPALVACLTSGPVADFLARPGPALLVNNAGLLQPVAPLGRQSPDAVTQAVSLNIAAPLVLANAFTAGVGADRERRIMHISSGAARNAYAGWSVYCATKAALDHHARAVALEAQPGLRICSLAPGVVDTDMQAEIRATPEALFPQRARFDALKRDAQLDSPERCATRLVDYILSDAFGKLSVADLRDLA